MSDRQYEDRERAMHAKHMNEIERAPLRERQEARADVLDMMKHSPEVLGERISWLANGSYGYGAMLVAKGILNAGSRTNKAAQLIHLLCAYDHNCPVQFCVDAYKKLSLAERARLDAEVKRGIAEAIEEMRGE